MSTVDPNTPHVNHVLVSLQSARPVEASVTASGAQPVMIIVVLITVLLLGGALKQLGRAFAPIGDLLRMVFAALAVAILLIAAVAVLIGGLVLSARHS